MQPACQRPSGLTALEFLENNVKRRLRVVRGSDSDAVHTLLRSEKCVADFSLYDPVRARGHNRSSNGVNTMSKGMDRKKENKKKPARTKDEKKAAKQDAKNSKRRGQPII